MRCPPHTISPPATAVSPPCKRGTGPASPYSGVVQYVVHGWPSTPPRALHTFVRVDFSITVLRRCLCPFFTIAEIIAYDGVVTVCPPISGRRPAACYGHLASLIPMEIGTAERRCGGKLGAQAVGSGHLEYRFCALSLGCSHCGR